LETKKPAQDAAARGRYHATLRIHPPRAPTMRPLVLVAVPAPPKPPPSGLAAPPFVLPKTPLTAAAAATLLAPKASPVLTLYTRSTPFAVPTISATLVVAFPIMPTSNGAAPWRNLALVTVAA
jgi:hypothetical protein